LSQEKIWAKKNKKVIDLDLLFGHDRDLTHSPQKTWGEFFTQLAHVISGGSPFKLIL